VGIGNLGEAAARRYLLRNGWRLLAKNVHLGRDELDILAMSPDQRIMAVVEVRSSRNPVKKPELTILRKKRATMLRVARQLHPLAVKHGCNLRVDVIAVQLGIGSPQINHYEGVFPLERSRNSF